MGEWQKQFWGDNIYFSSCFAKNKQLGLGDFARNHALKDTGNHPPVMTTSFP